MVTTVMAWYWPEDFPDGCPPEQAPPAEGIFYRIVKGDPPEQGDFISLYHQNPTRAQKVIESSSRTKCVTMGLSVFTEREDALGCAKQFPKLGDKIARLALTPQAGKALKTHGMRESHNTWWAPRGLDPVDTIQAVENT